MEDMIGVGSYHLNYANAVTMILHDILYVPSAQNSPFIGKCFIITWCYLISTGIKLNIYWVLIFLDMISCHNIILN